jgi:hypothetical protein
MYAAQVIPTCHAQGVIDADLSRSRRGVAEKGHLWTETNLFTLNIAWMHIDRGSGVEEVPFAGKKSDL